MEIMRLHAAGLSIREIAHRTGFARNTVRKYLRGPMLPRYGPQPRRPSKLDPFKPYLQRRMAWLRALLLGTTFKPYLQRRMATGVFNANRLLHELRALGYTGGVTILKDYLKPHRP